MKTILTAVLSAMLLSLCACNEAETPSQAIEHIVAAVQKNDLGSVSDYLLFDAKTEYANDAGLTKLREMLGTKQIQYSTPSKTTAEVQNNMLIEKFDSSLFTSGKTLKASVICGSQNINTKGRHSPSSGVDVTFCFVSNLTLDGMARQAFKEVSN